MLATLSWLLLRPDPVARAFSPAARAVLAKPDRVTIYAINSSALALKPSLGFQDAITKRPLSAREGREAVGALLDCLRSSDGLMMACFDPHHGLKIERGKRWVKVWVCFNCRQTQVQESGGRDATVGSGLAGRAVFDRLVPHVKAKPLRTWARP